MTTQRTGSTAPVRAGIIGLGAIGQRVVELAAEHAPGDIEFIGALVQDPLKPRPDHGIPMVATVHDLLALNPEVIVEAAGHEALRAHGPAILRSGCDLLFLGVGALADPELEHIIVDAAIEGGATAQVASGAIGALDAISAAAIGGIEKVTHNVRKPARTLLPHDQADALTGPLEMFRGPAREGALLFPESINVAAAVSLAGVGLDDTEVCVIADPAVSRNQHEVEVEGSFGWMKFEIRGIPTEENPKTGRIVAMSVVRQLLRRRAPLRVG
jgi:aspartate dehydrogenase